MTEDEIKQLQRQVSKLQLEAKLRKSVANELERQKNLVQKAKLAEKIRKKEAEQEALAHDVKAHFAALTQQMEDEMLRKNRAFQDLNM